MSVIQKEIIGYECKHVVYVPAQDGSPNDLLCVKEYRHFKDGTKEPSLRLIRNFKRPFYITREAFRKHKDKKEWEKLSKLQKFESTQIDLVPNINRALGKAPTRNSLRMIARSPYVYGADISSMTLTKHHYQTKWPTLRTDNSIAVLDSETDMIKGHEEIIMLSLTMESKAKIVIVDSFLENVIDREKKIEAACWKYFPEIMKSRNINLEIEFVKNPGECTFRIIQTAHQWKPDILAIWNMDFDVPKMVSVLEKYGYDPADVFSDPSIPRPFRSFKYIQGPAQKVTASGVTMALHPAERWHVVETPASFYVLDAMCVYLKLRIAGGKEPSYSLDAILKKHLNIGKLHFDKADHVKGGAWHALMQKEYPIEYCAYNLFDCISMELLDEEITDLRRLISTMCGPSEYSRFPSQPKRTCDDLHFLALEKGLVIATTSDKMQDDLDKHIVNLKGWIF